MQDDKINTVFFENNKLPYVLTMPISWMITLWVIVKKFACRVIGIAPDEIQNSIFFDKFGPKLRKIKEGAASWKALDVIYHHKFGQNKTIVGKLEDFWIGMMNAQSVRNRFKLINIKLAEVLNNFPQEEEIRMISLACGSAEVVIDTIASFKRSGKIIRVILVDIDTDALVYASQLAEKYGISDQVETKNTSVTQIRHIARDFKPHVVEMLGLLDYLPKEKAIKLIQKIHESLLPGGYFLTCNIKHNLEMHFLRFVINWPMIYRSKNELEYIVVGGGFLHTEIVYEPLKIHGIAIGQKSK